MSLTQGDPAILLRYVFANLTMEGVHSELCYSAVSNCMRHVAKVGNIKDLYVSNGRMDHWVAMMRLIVLGGMALAAFRIGLKGWAPSDAPVGQHYRAKIEESLLHTERQMRRADCSAEHALSSVSMAIALAGRGVAHATASQRRHQVHVILSHISEMESTAKGLPNVPDRQSLKGGLQVARR